MTTGTRQRVSSLGSSILLIFASSALVLTGCNQGDGGAVSSPTTSEQRSVAEPFAVYIGADARSERFTEDLTYRGRTIYLEPQPILTTEHLARAEREPVHRQDVMIRLTPEGREILEREAPRYLEQRLALMLDGEVLVAPFAMDPLSNLGLSPTVLDIPSDESLTAIMNRLNEIAAAKRQR